MAWRIASPYMIARRAPRGPGPRVEGVALPRAEACRAADVIGRRRPVDAVLFVRDRPQRLRPPANCVSRPVCVVDTEGLVDCTPVDAALSWPQPAAPFVVDVVGERVAHAAGLIGAGSCASLARRSRVVGSCSNVATSAVDVPSVRSAASSHANVRPSTHRWREEERQDHRRLHEPALRATVA